MKKITKLLAGAVILSMALGMTGCSKEGKFTAKKFQKVALENLEAEEYTIDDLDVDDPEEIAGDLMADIEDGIYINVTGEEMMDSDAYDEDILNIFYAVLDIDLDIEKIDSTSIYMRAEGEDKDDFYGIVSSLMEFSDKDAAAAYFQSLIHNLNRTIKIVNAVCDSDLNIEELDKDYYSYNGSNSGHLILKLSTDDLDIDEIDDIDGSATIVVGIYIEGKDFMVVACACADSEGCDEISEFYKLLGMKNPFEFEPNEMLIDFINDTYDNADAIAKKWMKKFQNSPLGETRY